MKLTRILIIIVAFSYLWEFCLAQSKKDIRKNGVKSLTEMIITYHDGKESTHQDSYQKFNKNGDVVDETAFDKNGKIKKRIVTKYNSLNDKTEETTFDE